MFLWKGELDAPFLGRIDAERDPARCLGGITAWRAEIKQRLSYKYSVGLAATPVRSVLAQHELGAAGVDMGTRGDMWG